MELIKYDETYKTIFGKYQQTVSGAIYELYTSIGDKVSFSGTNTEGFYVYDKAGTIKEIPTDENGKLKVTNLPWGNYYFKEKTAPTGYLLSDTKINFSVSVSDQFYLVKSEDDNGNVTGSDDYLVRKTPLEATDEETNVSIVLLKQDDKGALIDSAEFTLLVYADESAKGETSSRYSGLSTYNGKVTFKNPTKGISKIAIGGTYQIREDKANDAYKQPENEEAFSPKFKFVVGKNDIKDSTLSDGVTVEDADTNQWITTYTIDDYTIKMS